ncbi:TnsD family Tn7-like transposition protein [uncultured Marivirga sp.]|uniref:TnsD family Tn7-like transposition protein n=1 Tax=uncultured Marivirga sp. TaxID=1123707 RepID=UPI0030EDD9A1|tara:strand:- start:34960 stop:36792 length:1833 start_codon:yes stop_codon:yes gene_type:complete
MLYYWPHTYPDEILYSVIARYLKISGSRGPKHLLNNLFDRKTISATLDLPSGLKHLIHNLEMFDKDVEMILADNTLFPYYQSFLTPTKAEKVRHSMLSKSGDIHTLIGINAGIFPAGKSPKYCPLCVKEDKSENISPYLRRTHQIPSIQICTQHNIYLLELNKSRVNFNKHEFLFLEDHLDQFSLIEQNESTEYLNICKDIEKLLKGRQNPFDADDPFFYRKELFKHGLVKNANQLSTQGLYENFTDLYNDTLLAKFKSSVNLDNPSCWLKGIFRKHRKGFDPCRHVIIDNFLKYLETKNESLEVIEIENIKYPCLNKVCEHYNQSIQTTFSRHIDHKSKRQITLVECNCGHKYTHSYITSKQNYFTRIKEYGPVWHSKLNQLLVEEKMSIRAIARILGCDSKTVNKFKSIIVEGDSTPKTELETKQEIWQQHMRKNPKSGITELRKKKPALFAFLYRNCKEWLQKQKYYKSNPTSKLRINWKARDLEILQELRIARSNALTENPKKRITKSLLLIMVKKEKMFYNNQEKLENCDEYLSKIHESKYFHRKKRLVLSALEMKDGKAEISYWTLLRKAGIRKEYLNYELIQLAKGIVNGTFELSRQTFIKTA